MKTKIKYKHIHVQEEVAKRLREATRRYDLTYSEFINKLLINMLGHPKDYEEEKKEKEPKD